ncbi:MAG: hypothetical protein ABIW50_03550 [Candidatus Limnocylindria bacterium]
MGKRKAPEPVDPNRLSRQHAGTYRSGDDRFEVREADAGWFVVDTSLTNEFGQELIHGPYPTLKAAGESLPERRAAKAVPKPRAPKIPKRGSAQEPKKPEPAAPKPPPSWIDELSRADATDIRSMIAALETEGIGDAEAVVRRDRDGLLPAVAMRRVEERLAALVADLPEAHRDSARAVAQRVAEILSAEGTPSRGRLPGWALVEIGPGANPPARRIDLRR